MRARIKNTKANAREFLLPGYMYFIPVLFLYFIIDVLASAIPERLFSDIDALSTAARFGISFITNIFSGLAGVGLIKAAFDYIRREPFKASVLFYAFKNNSDQFVIIQLILVGIKTVFSLSGVLVNYITINYELAPLPANILYYGSVLLTLFLTMIATIRIMWANYFLIDGEAGKAAEALRLSLAFTKGRTMEVLYLKLSFAGYFFLSLCSMFVGFLYVKPYSEVAYLLYYLENKDK